MFVFSRSVQFIIVYKHSVNCSRLFCTQTCAVFRTKLKRRILSDITSMTETYSMHALWRTSPALHSPAAPCLLISLGGVRFGLFFVVGKRDVRWPPIQPHSIHLTAAMASLGQTLQIQTFGTSCSPSSPVMHSESKNRVLHIL